jgi:signal transduction histidine kinase
MSWHLGIFSFILILISVLSLSLAITGWRLRPVPGAWPFTVMMGAAAVWSFTYAFEISTADYVAALIILSLEIAAISIVPVVFFLFVLEYTGRDRLVGKKVIMLLFVIPVIAIASFISSPQISLYFISLVPEATSLFIIWRFSYGPVFYVHVAYSLILVFSGLIFILEQYVGFPAYRKQMAVLVIAWLIPTATVIMDAADYNPVLGLDITPFALLFSGLILGAAIRRYNFLSVMPIAHGALIQNLTEGFIVLNPQGVIVDLNTIAARIIGRPVDQLLGKPVGPSLPDILPILSKCGNSPDTVYDAITLSGGGTTHYFIVQCSPVRSRNNTPIGRLIVLRDVSELEITNLALEEANRKLSLISTLTRHDLSNQMTVLDGYTSILQEQVSDPKGQAYIAELKSSIAVIRRMLEFMQEYQSLGSKKPRWQKIGEVFLYAKSHLNLGGITVTTELDDLYVFADPLLEKALTNLLDNSIRHGGGISTITLTYTRTARGVTLVYEDNGLGIADNEKEKIFKRGYGRNQGFGLYLVRVILSISGMSIRETGIPGKGARFEIDVPEGAYGFSHGTDTFTTG